MRSQESVYQFKAIIIFLGASIMDRIEWNDSYLLEIPEIDKQHKKLLKIANDLYEVLSNEADTYKVEMSKVLKGLTDYTVYHFSFEEKFMRKYGYVGADAHKLAHDGFIAEVNRQVQSLALDNRNSGLAFYKFLVNLILFHIAKADHVLADFVRPKL